MATASWNDRVIAQSVSTVPTAIASPVVTPTDATASVRWKSPQLAQHGVGAGQIEPGQQQARHQQQHRDDGVGLTGGRVGRDRGRVEPSDSAREQDPDPEHHQRESGYHPGDALDQRRRLVGQSEIGDRPHRLGGLGAEVDGGPPPMCVRAVLAGIVVGGDVAAEFEVAQSAGDRRQRLARPDRSSPGAAARRRSNAPQKAARTSTEQSPARSASITSSR